MLCGCAVAYSSGPAHFWAIASGDLTEQQLRWLRTTLEASSARWKVVYSHQPIGKLNLFIAGSGGASNYGVDSSTFAVRFIDNKAGEVYHASMTK